MRMQRTQPDKGATGVDIQLPSTKDVVDLLRLLIAADTFPRGGLYSGYYCLVAALRYEYIWQKVLRSHGTDSPPPLDVALAWFIHRQFPVSYAHFTARRCGKPLHPPDGSRAFSFSARRSEPWQQAAHGAPAWPPPAPGSEHDPTCILSRRKSVVAVQLAEAMSRCGWLLHSWLRPHFLDEAFLERARGRYLRFLQLHAAHPDAPLVPAADIALLWHTHLGLSGRYAEACGRLYGSGAAPWRPAYLDLEGAALELAYDSTARLYQETYGEPYADRHSGWLPASEPHPLAAALSPLAFALRAFEDSPQQAADLHSNFLRATSLMSAPSCAGSEMLFPFSFSGRSTQAAEAPQLKQQQQHHHRAGAHALFAAWAASSRASAFFDRQTCHRMCFTRSWSLRLATVEQMVVPLVCLAHLRGGCLPDCSEHPFLEAVAAAAAARKGRWQPDAAGGDLAGQEKEGGVEQEAQQAVAASATGNAAESADTPRQRISTADVTVMLSPTASRTAARRHAPPAAPAGMFATGAGFTPRDAEDFLDDPAMVGLTALLSARADRRACETEGAPGVGVGEAGKGSGREEGGSGGAGKKKLGEPGNSSVEASASFRKVGGYGDAPLWGILHDEKYFKRAGVVFDNLWADAVKRGVDHLLPAGEADKAAGSDE